MKFCPPFYRSFFWTIAVISTHPLGATPVQTYLQESFPKLLEVEAAVKNLEAEKQNLEIAQSRFRTEFKSSAALKSATLGGENFGGKNYSIGVGQDLPLGLGLEAAYTDQVPGFGSTSSLQSYQLRSLEISQNLWPNFLGRTLERAEKISTLDYEISNTETSLILIASCKRLNQLVTRFSVAILEKKILEFIVTKNQKALDWARLASKERRIRSMDLLTAEEQSLETQTRLKESEARVKQIQKTLESLNVSMPSFELNQIENFLGNLGTQQKKFELASFPDFKKSGLQLNRQNLVAQATTNDVLPQIQHSVTFANKDSPSPSQTENNLSWGVSLSVPLWGQKEWKIKNREDLRYSSQILKHQNEKNSLESQIEILKSDLALAADQLKEAETLKFLAQKKANESELALRKGQAGFFEFASYERNSRQAELNYLSRFSKWSDSILEIEALTGDLLELCQPRKL